MRNQPSKNVSVLILLRLIAAASQMTFHLVLPSNWPLLSASAAFASAASLIAALNGQYGSGSCLLLALLSVICSAALWFRDILRESLYEGSHSSIAVSGLKLGMLLFIASEAALFAAFF